MNVIRNFKSKKNEQYFKITYEKNYDIIFRRIYYLTGDKYAAEDLTQEVFTKLYKSPPEHDNVVAWLNKVSTNVSYNYIRDNKAHHAKEVTIYEDEVVSIEDRAIGNCETVLARKVLNMLQPRERICLLLKFSGYKYNEIAEVIEVDKGSVGTIIARAQAKFKECYIKAEMRGEI